MGQHALGFGEPLADLDGISKHNLLGLLLQGLDFNRHHTNGALFRDVDD